MIESKRKKLSIASLLMAMVITLTTILPGGIAYGDIKDDIKAEIVANTKVNDFGIKLEQEDWVLPGALDSGKTIKVSGNLEILRGSNPSDTSTNLTRKGDEIDIWIGQSFPIFKEYSGDLYLNNDPQPENYLGQVKFYYDSGTQKLRLKMIFDDHPTDSTLKVTTLDDLSKHGDGIDIFFMAEMSYGKKAEDIPEMGEEFILYDKTYTIMPNPSDFATGITKSGAPNYADQTIEWTTTLNPHRKATSKKLSLSGYTFRDDLTSVGEYVDGSFQLTHEDGVTAFDFTRLSTASNVLAYKFEDGLPEGNVTVKFKTKIDPTLLNIGLQYNTDSKGKKTPVSDPNATVTNTAELTKEGFDKGSDTAKVQLIPERIQKTGKSTGGLLKDREIRWTILVNKNSEKLKNAFVLDPMPTSDPLGQLRFVSYKIYRDKDRDGTYEVEEPEVKSQPAGDKYPLGDIDYPVKLEIVTKVNDSTDTTLEEVKYTNKATLISDEITDENVAYDESTVGIGVNVLKKTASLGSPKDSTIKWTLTLDKGGQTLNDLSIMEVFIYDQHINWKRPFSTLVFGAGITDAEKTAVEELYKTKHEYKTEAGTTYETEGKQMKFSKYVDSSYDISKTRVIPIHEGTNRVGEVVFFDIDDSVDKVDINLTSKVVGLTKQSELSSVAEIRNTATLLQGAKKITEAAVNAKITTAPMWKDSMMRTAHGDYSISAEFAKLLAKEQIAGSATHLNPDASDYEAKRAAARTTYNYEDNTIIYRLSFNSPGVNYETREVFDGTSLTTYKDKEIIYTDILPEGWDFVEITSGEEYLMYIGNVGDGAKVLLPGTPTKTTASDENLVIEKTKVDGRNAMHFKFTNLKKSYVIFVKAKPSEETLKQYLQNEKSTFVFNEFNFKNPFGTDYLAKMKNYALIEFDQVLEKNVDGKTYESLGLATWTIDYKPFGSTQKDVVLIDKLPEGINLPRDNEGNVIDEFEIPGKGKVPTFTMEKTKLKSDGTYESLSTPEFVTIAFENSDKDFVAGKNVLYNPDTRKLSFFIPDGTDGYRLTYHTFNEGSPGITVKNEVEAKGFTKDLKKVVKELYISEASYGAQEKLGAKIEITKIDATTKAPIKTKDATFVIYPIKDDGVVDETKQIAKGTTDENGKLVFRAIPPGRFGNPVRYVLKEFVAPEGYKLDNTEYKFTITRDSEGNYKAKFDTTSNHEITIENTTEDVPSGNLEVSKKVVDGDNGQVFEFKMEQLTGGEYDFAIINGRVTVKTGKIKQGDTFEMKHGDTLFINNMTPGTKVVIKETPVAYYDPYITVNGGTKTKKTDGKSPEVTIEDGKTATIAYENKFVDGKGGPSDPGGGDPKPKPPTPPTDPKPPTEEPIVPPVTPGGGPGGGGGGGISDETIGDDGVPKANRDKDGDDKTTRIQGAPKTGLPYRSLFRETLGQSLLYSATLMLAIVFVQNESARRRKF